MVNRHFIPSIKRAKLRRIRFHDIRHTYAALLIAQAFYKDVPEDIITKVYSRLPDEFINIIDIVHVINFRYKAGPEPVIMMSADVNKDHLVNILDIVLLINYKYKSGPAPECWQ